MDNVNPDLARGTFVEHWPHWVRWLLFIPASLVAPLLFIIIQYLTTTWYLGLDADGFWFNLLRGAAWGGGSVLAGATVAPKSQKLVALLFLVVIAMTSGLSLLVELQHFVLNKFLELLVTLGAAIYATHYIYKEADNA